MDYSNASNEELEQLVQKKDGDAICELGERCMYGTKGHVRNLTRAYQLFHKGEKLGLKRAYIGLGKMYEQGLYFAKNERLANEYYQKAGGYQAEGYQTEGYQSEGYQTEKYHTEGYQTGGYQTERYQTERYQTEEYQTEEYQTEEYQTGGQDDSWSDTWSDSWSGSPASDYSNIYSAQENNTSDIKSDVRRTIDSAEHSRQRADYASAKREAARALQMLDNIASGVINYSGAEDMDILRIDAYWVLAYTAYNEQSIYELEEYLSKDGVLALHPWGAYLAAVMHKNMNSPDIVLEQDLQNLTMVRQNQNLTMSEKGDVAMMIAELIESGYGRSMGYTVNDAHSYYSESAGYGNQYAKEHMSGYMR